MRPLLILAALATALGCAQAQRPAVEHVGELTESYNSIAVAPPPVEKRAAVEAVMVARDAAVAVDAAPAEVEAPAVTEKAAHGF